MKQTRRMMVALIAVSLTAVLLSYGCRSTSSQTGAPPVAAVPAAGLVPVAATPDTSVPVAAPPDASAPAGTTPDTSAPGAAVGKMYAELANPQSDDQGNYVPLPRDENYSLTGYASAQRPLAHVIVNDVEADTFAANYQPYGAPSGYSPIGFRVPLTLSPDSLVTVHMTDADGYRETMIFHPDRPRAHARVQQLWQVSQSDPYANLRMANTYAVEGDYPQAYERYHRSIGLNAGFVWGPFFLGVALYNNNRYDDAEWQFRHCSRIDSRFYLAHYQVGQCYERRGDYSSAILEYRVVIGSRPQFVEAHWSLGESYAQQNNWGGATVEYRQAIQYNPRFAPAHRGLGESLAHQGQWASASASLRVAASLNPRDARTRADLSSTLVRQQRSPQQYRMAMAPLSAPRGSAQGPARNVQNTQAGRPYPAGGQQQARPSGAQQARASGGQQARPSGVQQARTSGGQQARPTATQQGRTSGGQQPSQAARPAARQQARPSPTQADRPSGGQQHSQAAKPAAHQQAAKPAAHQQAAKPAAKKPAASQEERKDKAEGR